MDTITIILIVLGAILVVAAIVGLILSRLTRQSFKDRAIRIVKGMKLEEVLKIMHYPPDLIEDKKKYKWTQDAGASISRYNINETIYITIFIEDGIVVNLDTNCLEVY